jgi:hypothetical protein
MSTISRKAWSLDFLSSILKIVKKSFYRWTSFLLFKKLSVREEQQRGLDLPPSGLAVQRYIVDFRAKAARWLKMLKKTLPGRKHNRYLQYSPTLDKLFSVLL